MPKCVTSGGVHLRGLPPGQHSSEKTSLQWRAIGDAVSDLTGPEIEPKTCGAHSDVFHRSANWPVLSSFSIYLTLSHFNKNSGLGPE